MPYMNERNIVYHHATVTRARRERLNGHKSTVVWFTGFSGSGKSTLAHSIEEELHQRAVRTFVFDGDNVRHGLCADLGFGAADRTENIRRIAEMCKLFVEGGIISLGAFISPFREQRKLLRDVVGASDFIEIFCDCSLEVCESRDRKGIYKRARAGEIAEFTGISSPYERPENADLILDTGNTSLEECVTSVMSLLADRGIIKG